MAGELLIQVIDTARFRAIRPALDELDASRALGLKPRAVLNEAASSPFAHSERHQGFAELLGRILRHPELELRVFLSPRELDQVIEGLVHILCFENAADFSLISPVGQSWVVLDIALSIFGDLDWFRATFFRAFDPNAEDRPLAYPRAGLEGRYYVLTREDVALVATGLRPLLDDPIPAKITAQMKTRAEQLHLQVLMLSQEVRAGAEGLARLAAKALSREELTLARNSPSPIRRCSETSPRQGIERRGLTMVRSLPTSMSTQGHVWTATTG